MFVEGCRYVLIERVVEVVCVFTVLFSVDCREIERLVEAWYPCIVCEIKRSSQRILVVVGI